MGADDGKEEGPTGADFEGRVRIPKEDLGMGGEDGLHGSQFLAEIIGPRRGSLHFGGGDLGNDPVEIHHEQAIGSNGGNGGDGMGRAADHESIGGDGEEGEKEKGGETG